MRKLIALLLVVGLLAAGCGGGSADTCEGVADATIDAVQKFIDATADIELNDLMAVEDDADIAGFTEFETTMTDLEAKADELECTDQEMGELLAARAGDLDPKGFLGQMIAGAIAEGETDIMP